MPVEIVVIAESALDARIVTGLCDRVINECGPEWIRDNPEVLDAERCYRGIETGATFLKWSKVPTLAAQSGKRIRAFSWGKNRGMADCAATRKALALVILMSRGGIPDFVILSRDTDNEVERWLSWKTVVDEGKHRFGIILAAQHPKLEAWLLNGFVPSNAAEKKRLKDLRQALGFDPTISADRLIAEGKKGKKNAKKVLSQLTANDEVRRDCCWSQVSLDHLKSTGCQTGLAEFIEQIEITLLPTFERLDGKG